MDIVHMAVAYAAAHQQLVVGLVAGAALSNPGTCATVAFGLVTKVPGVGSWIGRNPEKAKAWADSFDKAIDACVDKYAAAQQKGEQGAEKAP